MLDPSTIQTMTILVNASTFQPTNLINDSIDLTNPKLGTDYIPTKSFALNNQKLLLTYPDHLHKQDYSIWFNNNVHTYSEIYLAHETSINNYRHTHVLINLGSQYKVNKKTIFDYLGQHPNIKKIITKVQWKNCMHYIAKQDPENKHLKETAKKIDVSFSCEDIWACDSLRDALSLHCKKFTDASGIVTVWANKPKIIVSIPLPNHPWHQDLLNYLNNFTPSLRQILWYYDPVGNAGKTWITKYLAFTFPDKFTFINNCGGIRDFSTIIENSIKNGWLYHGIIFDFGRDAETKSIYEPLETIKNGTITTTKYVGSSFLIDTPHTIVFANFLPNITKLSNDRWLVLEITEKYTAHVIYNGDKTSPTFTPTCPWIQPIENIISKIQ